MDQANDTNPVTPEPGPSDEVPPGSWKRPRLLGITGVVLLLVVLVGFVATRGEDVEPREPAATTVKRQMTTTTRKLPVGSSEIATVKDSVDRVKVLADQPASWDEADEGVVPVIASLPPRSQDSAPAREEIPTRDSPVTGRYAVDDGWEFTNPGPFKPPQPLTFLVTERRGDWVKVLLPVRPNGTEGYISARDVKISDTANRVEIDLSEHKLTAYDGNEVIAQTSVVTGVAFSPTPTGRFYLTDKVPYANPDGDYGPFVLATNGYSETLDEFADGVPVVALHGTNRPDLLGQDRSNGCVRLPNEVITKLADTLPLGTPVYIWP